MERDFCSRLSPPLFVVTATSADERSGCLVGFATQCSIKPTRMLVGISLLNHTYEVAKRADALGLHLLGAGQHEMAELFGGKTGDEVDKFAQCTWHLGESGAPLLDDCAAWMEGAVLEKLILGDHLGFVLSVLRSGLGQEQGELHLHDVQDIEPGHPPEELDE